MRNQMQENKKCEACEGSGYVYVYPDSTKQCPLCGGTGTIEMVLPTPFAIGEVVERIQEACPACSGTGRDA